MIYLPMVGVRADSWAVGSPAYVVKSTRADLLAPDIRTLMREVIPESPMYRIFTMEGLAARSMAQLSFTMLMLAIASGLALILGAVGLYGVLSYVVSRRAPEIAVRMALGAEATRVRRMVVMQGARVTLGGVAFGLVAAIAFTRVLDSLLYGVGTLDVLTFVAMSGVMVAVALLASYIPARRASSVDPMQSLRAE
jgi:ABC-type antimicrobial peptide transport system permease subunit